jgi:PAS domain S-box-containing protein
VLLDDSENELLALAADSGYFGFYRFSLKSKQFLFSKSMFTMLGYVPDSLPGTIETYRSLTHPDHLAPQDAAFLSLASGKVDHYVYETRVRTASGEYRWIEVQARRARIQHDGDTIIAGTHIDIHPRKVEELRRAESEARLALAVGGAKLALWDIDLEANAYFVAPEWYEQLGVASGEIRADNRQLGFPRESRPRREAANPRDLD